MEGCRYMKCNKGVTLVELIIAMALIFIVLPFAWNYINSSIQDNATINNKVAVQTSVNSLMNQMQKDVQEARYPINPNTEDYIDAESDGFLICKPNAYDDEGNTVYQSVLYKFDEENSRVTVVSGIKLVPPGIGETEYGIDDSNASYNRFDFIKSFDLERQINSNGINNGVKIEIRGEIDSKSGYSLNNVYYTRNTLF